MIKILTFDFDEETSKLRPIPCNENKIEGRVGEGHLVRDVEGCISCAYKTSIGGLQEDDGSREGLKHFLEHRDKKLVEVLTTLSLRHDFFKARVFLELLWEYESKK